MKKRVTAREIGAKYRVPLLWHLNLMWKNRTRFALTSRLACLLVLGISSPIVFAPQSAHAQIPSSFFAITNVTAGRNLGVLTLGRTPDEVTSLLGTPSKSEERGPGVLEQAWWSPLTGEIRVIYVGGELVQAEATSPLFRTSEGLSSRSSQDQFAGTFGLDMNDLRVYKESDSNGRETLSFYVMAPAGLSLKSRPLSNGIGGVSIIMHRRGSDVFAQSGAEALDHWQIRQETAQSNQSQAARRPVSRPASSPSRAATPNVIPGERLGKIRLGMTQSQTRKILGRPTATLHLQNGVTDDVYRSKSTGHKLEVLFSRGRVVQIEATSPTFRTKSGLSTQTPLSVLRRALTNVRYVTYGYGGSMGAVKYYIDHVGIGLAFESGGHQDDWFEETPPQTIIVHRKGVRVIPDQGGEFSDVKSYIPFSS